MCSAVTKKPSLTVAAVGMAVVSASLSVLGIRLCRERSFVNFNKELLGMTKKSKLSVKDIVMIKLRLAKGDMQHDIAADYGINQGRISEINTGKRYASVPAV